jgi:hypothetical protein
MKTENWRADFFKEITAIKTFVDSQFDLMVADLKGVDGEEEARGYYCDFLKEVIANFRIHLSNNTATIKQERETTKKEPQIKNEDAERQKLLEMKRK